MTHFLNRLKAYQLPIISGLLVATSYPPFPSWAVTFCWVPLWFFAAEQKSLKTTFWGGWWTQFVLSMIGFHWVAHTAYSFGNLPWTVAVPALFLFAGLVHLHIPVAILLINKIRGEREWPTWSLFFAYALTTSLLERIWPMIFPWHMGYSLLFSRLEMYQLAEFVGFAGLSTWLFLLNAGMATGLWLWNKKKAHGAVFLTSSIAIFFLCNIFGSLIRPTSKTHPIEKTVKVLIVQANIGQFEKIMAEKHLKSTQGELQKTVQDIYFRLTDEALSAYPEAELIVWPETALADYLDLENLTKPRQMELRAKVASWNRGLVTGAYSRDSKTEAVYNATFTFNHRGELSAPPYRKSELLAFGEYLPLSEEFPWLLKLVPFVSSFAKGPGPEVKPIQLANQNLVIAPQICYESLYPKFSRIGALAGGELLVNATNDSWFGRQFEPFQHGTMNWARAIETRRPLVRSTNTGQSAIVTHKGKALIKSPIGEQWYGMAEVPIPQKTTTFFMKYGYLDWIVYLMFLLALLWRMKQRENTGRNL